MVGDRSLTGFAQQYYSVSRNRVAAPAQERKAKQQAAGVCLGS